MCVEIPPVSLIAIFTPDELNVEMTIWCQKECLDILLNAPGCYSSFQFHSGEFYIREQLITMKRVPVIEK